MLAERSRALPRVADDGCAFNAARDMRSRVLAAAHDFERSRPYFNILS